MKAPRVVPIKTELHASDPRTATMVDAYLNERYAGKLSTAEQKKIINSVINERIDAGSWWSVHDLTAFFANELIMARSPTPMDFNAKLEVQLQFPSEPDYLFPAPARLIEGLLAVERRRGGGITSADARAIMKSLNDRSR